MRVSSLLYLICCCCFVFFFPPLSSLSARIYSGQHSGLLTERKRVLGEASCCYFEGVDSAIIKVDQIRLDMIRLGLIRSSLRGNRVTVGVDRSLPQKINTSMKVCGGKKLEIEHKITNITE